MITTPMMYLIVKLDSIIKFFSIMSNISIGFTVVCVLVIGIGHCVYGTSSNSPTENEDILTVRGRAWKICKKFIIALIVCNFIKCFLPTTKEMAAIYIIPKVANSEFVNETFPNELKDIYMMSKDWMKGFLKEKESDTKETVKKVVSDVVSNTAPQMITIKLER